MEIARGGSFWMSSFDDEAEIGEFWGLPRGKGKLGILISSSDFIFPDSAE